MKNFKVMLLLILGSYLIITANAGCHSDERENNDCPYNDVAIYDGPPGEIVQGDPSLPSDVSFEQSAALDASLDIISGAIGLIPEVGALLSGYFTAFRTIFGASKTEEALEAFYSALSEEVDAIINYVDQKVLELQVSDIKAKIGGLETAALDCTNHYSVNAQDMKTCLIAVRADIVGEVQYFFPDVPKNPTPEDVNEQAPLLQQLLPMWRHYGDLYFAVTLELVTTMRHLGDEEEATSLLKEIPDIIKKFTDFYSDVMPIIRFYSAAILDPSDFVARQCYFWEGNSCAFKARTYYIGQFKGVFGPSGYKSESLNCLAEGYVGCKVWDGLQKAYDKGWEMFIADQDAWIKLRLQQVDKYYKEQFDRTMSKWNYMKEYIGNLELKSSDQELQHIVTRVINPSYTITFNSSRSTLTKDDIPDGIRNEVLEFDDVNYKGLKYCSSKDCRLHPVQNEVDDVNYKELRYCSSKDCDPVGMASFQICISSICQNYCSGDWC